jgi:hypothetical protein
MSDLPQRVFIDEEGPREGFQSAPAGITVANKVRLIEALAETGLKRIPRREGAAYSALMPAARMTSPQRL